MDKEFYLIWPVAKAQGKSFQYYCDEWNWLNNSLQPNYEPIYYKMQENASKTILSDK